jgi:hypothetical protein
MISLYYIFSLLFIWMNIYYLLNISKLNTRLINRDLYSVEKIEYIWYLTKTFYWIWLFIGLFIPQVVIYSILNILLGIIKFPLFHINSKIYKVWCLFMPLISSFILFLIFILILI